MSEAIIIAILGIVSSVVTGIITKWSTKRKYNTEVDSNQIKNMQESLDFYASITEQNRKELAILISSNDELMNTNKTLVQQNTELLLQNQKLITEVEELKGTVVQLTLQLSEYRNSDHPLVLVGN